MAFIAVAATVLGTGCVTNGRQIFLKEYGPSVPPLADVNLKGTTVCLKDFKSAPSLVAMKVTTEEEEPKPFKYLDMTHEQDMMWSQEMRELQKKSTKANLREIGNMRNGFGMVMSHVYALNDPAEWVKEGLKYDLEAQGATVVDASQAASADVSVSATIQLCCADMYMTENSQLVIDLDVQPKQGEAGHRQIHTHGATAAFLASEGEYFHAYRDAREKFSIFTAYEIAKSLKAKP